MSDFDRAFDLVIGAEGRLSMDPRDRGNWTGGEVNAGELKGTKFGISARSYPALDIAALTVDQAKAIALADFWQKHHCDQMPWPVSAIVFDGAFNQGSVGAEALQDALGVKADGVIGPITLDALAKADTAQTATLTLTFRAKAYVSDSDYWLYGKGWLDRLFGLALKAGLA